MSAVELGPVVFLLSQLGVGGSEAKTVRLANALAERGIDVTLAYLSEPATLAASLSTRVTRVDLRRRGKLSIPAVRRLAALLRARHARTLVTVNLYPALYGRLALLGMGRNALRFVACLNTSELLPRERVKMPLYRWTLRGADAVVFGAEGQRRLWRERHGIGTRTQRTAVLYNGVDTARFTPGREATACRRIAPPTRLLVGTVGRLRPEKAQVDLLRATARLRARGLDVGALIVGEGDTRPTLEAEIAALGIGPHVTLAGESHDVRPYLACLDVFVLTSVAVETFSNAALEAMACGLPIVSSEIGGMPELLAFGGGLGYSPGNVAELTEQLALLLEDAERRARLGGEARRAAVEHFSWERMVDEFLAVLGADGSGRDSCDRSAPRPSPA